ncbi:MULTISPECIES: amino acid ABC transporter permease [unclassified Variovorax]|uniref:amino acid ABC transporter permease n=1 Tax=unclassified Variovorax TaxID=663243 RepID=UPI002578502B|nr:MULTISPECIES: amino acid ABC transporter permease [unclassified Variovorax]MDM0086636.1 amino acid ABC transporter permease [Variovorax sp. J22G40]MDM0145108.1 amino acid ABC transporter permease [Variovorax sp. J2P1-31]
MNYTLDFSWLQGSLPMLWSGLQATVFLTVVACALGSLVGIVGALGRNSAWLPFRAAATAYVEAIRNTPLLAQAFLIYFGLPALGISLTPMVAAGLALTINCGAYTAEIFRAGFEAIQKSQHEAATALNLSRRQTFLHIVLPQAFRSVYPALSAQFVLILMASSITSQISAEEISAAANQIQSTSFRGFEVYLLISLVYLAMVLAMKSLFSLIGGFLLRNSAGGRLVAERAAP